MYTARYMAPEIESLCDSTWESNYIGNAVGDHTPFEAMLSMAFLHKPLLAPTLHDSCRLFVSFAA